MKSAGSSTGRESGSRVVADGRTMVEDTALQAIPPRRLLSKPRPRA